MSVKRDWIYIERDQGARDVIVGPYPDGAAAALAMEESLLIDYLLSPKGGGGVDCYTTEIEAGAEPDVEQQWIDLTNPDHTGITDESERA